MLTQIKEIEEVANLAYMARSIDKITKNFFTKPQHYVCNFPIIR